MPLWERVLDTDHLPQLDIDDPIQRPVLAGVSVVYTRDPHTPGGIVGCRIERERGLVPLFTVFQPGSEESGAEGERLPTHPGRS